MKIAVCCLGMALLTGVARAELDIKPAARMHVRYVDGAPMRFSSKLSNVVEMNFTLGFHHTEGKQAISSVLDKIARDYAVDGKSPFTIMRFTGPGFGASQGLPNPSFTLATLLSAEVIVANNVSLLDQLPTQAPAAASAFETAVKQEGRSVLSFHASAEGTDRHWAFYDQCLNPMIYKSHGSRVSVPVYKDERESRHVALEGVLASGTPKEVPMGVDGSGNEILRQDVATRLVKNESNNYARNILTDTVFRALITPLLRYDPRFSGTSDIPRQYRYAGGHAYAFILKAGNGKTGYISTGHDATETDKGTNSFDAGTGDFERFYAQMLFFLSGYKSEACGEAVDCMGLHIVDSLDHLTGETYGSTALVPRVGAGTSLQGSVGPWQAALTDVRGRLMAVKKGWGTPVTDFRGLAPGIYFLHIRTGKGPTHIRRYLVPLHPQ